MKRGWLFGKTVLGVMIAEACWAQSLVICKSCGHEAKPGATMCSHCSKALPQAVPQEAMTERPLPVKAEKGAAMIPVVAKAVEAEYRQAQEIEREQPGLALCHYKNAMALMCLLPKDHFPKEVRQALMKGADASLLAISAGMLRCRKCKGTGQYQLDYRKVSAGAGVKGVDGVACTACKGRGGFPGLADVIQTEAALAQGREKFGREKMLEGARRVGRVFVPEAIEAQLTTRQRALVMIGLPAPCDTCKGSGRQACATCKKNDDPGWMKCPNASCKNGRVEQEIKEGRIPLKRINEEDQTRCPTCSGLGHVICTSCRGLKSMPCKSCSGNGIAPSCTRCAGTGLSDCTKCKGSGEVKGSVCVACKGEGVCLCTTCNGGGAKTR